MAGCRGVKRSFDSYTLLALSRPCPLLLAGTLYILEAPSEARALVSECARLAARCAGQLSRRALSQTRCCCVVMPRSRVLPSRGAAASSSAAVPAVCARSLLQPRAPACVVLSVLRLPWLVCGGRCRADSSRSGATRTACFYLCLLSRSSVPGLR